MKTKAELIEENEGLKKELDRLKSSKNSLKDQDSGINSREQQIQESEARYRTLFESANDAILLMDEEKFLSCNTAAIELFGCQSEDDLIRHTPWEFSPKMQANGESSILQGKALIKKALNNEAQIFEWKHCKKNGQAFDAEVSLSAIPYKGVTYLQSIVRNISARKASETALLREKEELGKILSSLNIGLILVNTDYEIVWTNQKIKEIFPWGESLGKKCYEFFEGRDAPKDSCAVKECIESGNTSRKENFNEKNKRWYLSIAQAVKDENANVFQVLESIIDITEKKEREIEKEKTRINLQEAYKLSKIGSWEYNLKSDTLRWSDELYSILGYSKDDNLNINKLFKELIHPEDASEVNQYFRELITKGIDKSIEFRAFRKDSSLIYLQCVSHPVRDENGNIIGIFGVDQDISERKKMTIALEESEKKYRNVINNSQEGIFVIQNEKFVFANKTLEAITGFPWEEMKNKNFMDFVYQDDKEYIYTYYKDKIISAGIPGYDLRILLNGGNILWVRINTTRIIWEGEEAILCFITDIDKGKKAEEAIRESEERLRSLINSTPDIICFKDGKGRWLEANEADLELFHLENVDYRGKTDAELSHYTHPVFKDAFLMCEESDEKAWKGKKACENDEVITQPDGSKKIFNVIKVPLFDNKGKRKGIVVLGRDVTERKKFEEELLRAKEKAEESDRLKSAFLANMSHEIRTPMNGILGFSDLLKDPALSGEEQKKYLELIEKSGDRMLNTINDLINISKIESGQLSLHYSPTNINGQLEEIYSFFSPEAIRKNLTIKHFKGLSDDKAVIIADQEKLFAILSNLVKNAIKYTHHGEISFGYTHKGNDLEFFVRDTGIGIAKNRQKAIFERFVQADLSITKPYEGSGLGLAITKAYIVLMKGKIWLESQTGKGSVFYFSLPYIKTDK